MDTPLLSTDDFREAARSGDDDPDGVVYRFANSDAVTVGDPSARTKTFVFSEGSVDLAGDSIAVKGWDTADFKRNPVALFSHASWEPPIGRAKNVKIRDSKLVGDIEFASADVYPFADTIYRLVDGGFLKAVSVGFKPLEWAFSSDKDRPYGINFRRQKLLEISVCCVPCNPQALLEARSVGIDTRPLKEWAERVLDDPDTGPGMVSRREIERIRIDAAEPKRGRKASTAAQRLRDVAALRSTLAQSAPPRTPAERLIEARDITRSLKARGMI
ncbi:MAG: hypothetical protein JWR80_8104 [Bradyrhizobium sp.]|nr:hypothetical protein [Bradyrhizobium sp.]